MIETNGDPRVAEILRRRSASHGAAKAEAPTPPPPGPEAAAPRRLDDEGKAEIRRRAEENHGWSASDLADDFEAAHGWRPSCQGIGRSLSDPATPARRPRRPGAARKADPQADPGAEVSAIAAVARALGPLTPSEVRRVLAWAGARFDAKEGGGS